MKWPLTLTFIRHGESAYNSRVDHKHEDPDYQEFSTLFSTEFNEAKDIDWASPRLRGLARAILAKDTIPLNDYDTPLTETGRIQARRTGEQLATLAPLPDVVYVSTYLRTRQTLEMLKESWPALKTVKTVHDERIRELEHGLSTVYNDWRIYLVLNPEQGLLMKTEGDYAYRYLNGENKPDVRDRIRSFLATLLSEHAEENVLMVSHHLTLLSLRALLEHWSREEFIEVDRTDEPINCGFTLYRGRPELGQNGKIALDTYNKRLY